MHSVPLSSLPTPVSSALLPDSRTNNSGAGHSRAQSGNNNVQEPSDSPVQKIAQFWKNKRDNWTPPSKYIKSFKQIFRLHKLRDLMSQPEVVMGTLFHGEVEYRFSPAFAWCQWPGRDDWITHARAASATEAEAKRGVAMKAMTEVLGEQLTEYCAICESTNYVGVDEKELVAALASEGLINEKNQEEEVEEGELWESEEELESSMTSEQRAHQSTTAGASSATTDAGETSKDNHPVRYFSDSILEIDREKWITLGREEKEQVLFGFWFKTSWGNDFPSIMNLLKQKDPLNREAVQAFMGLFSSDGSKSKRKGVEWLTSKTQDDSYSAECIWRDQWNNEQRVQGTGQLRELARLDAAQKALKDIFCPEDLRVLQHVTSDFIYKGTKPFRPRNIVVWEKLRDAKLLENGHETLPAARLTDTQVSSTPPEPHTISTEACGGSTSRNGRSVRYFNDRILDITPGLLEILDQNRREGLGLATIEDFYRQAHNNEASAEQIESRSLKSKQNHSVRYFDDSILKITPEIWETLSKDEREQKLFDFWIRTSWGEDFPWTMNLLLERDPTGDGALPAFQLLFSVSRDLNKQGVNWRVHIVKKDFILVSCRWRDQWNKSFCMKGGAETLDGARKCTAQKALSIVFCPEDLNILRHVHSPFIYEGPESHRVDINNLWNRLKEAKQAQLRDNSGRKKRNKGCLTDQGQPEERCVRQYALRSRTHRTDLQSTANDRKQNESDSNAEKPQMEDGVTNSDLAESTETQNSSDDVSIERSSSYVFKSSPSPSDRLPDTEPMAIEGSCLRRENLISPADGSEESNDSHSPNSINEPPVRYFDDSILDITPYIWKTLSKDEREEILFNFWIQTSWGKGFPSTMNLALRKSPTCRKDALVAFLLLFSERRRLKHPKMKLETIRQEKEAVGVDCVWQDQWNKEHCVHGAGKNIGRARSNAAWKALRMIFCPKDLRVLEHINKRFFYGGPDDQCVNITGLWNRLKEAKCQQKRQEEQEEECSGDSDVEIITDSESVNSLENAGPDTSTVIPSLSLDASAESSSPHVASSSSQQQPDAGPNATEVSCRQPDPDSSSSNTAAETTNLPSSNEQKDQCVRYFDDRILQVTPEIWETLSRVEREQRLFDFWMKTSWGAGFPWTMNLFQQRNPFGGGGALAAFLLLFSDNRKLNKKGVNWRTINEENGLITVRCTWRDQWYNKHFVDGTGANPGHAKIDAAKKALRIVFCSDDLRVLRHVHSPFIYDGPKPQRMKISRLWNRLKKAKLREKEQTQPSGESSRTRRRNPRGSRSIVAGGELNSTEHDDQESCPDSSLPILNPPPAVTETHESQRTSDESPPDDSLDDPFAEYFSNNDDGTLEIPAWFVEKYLKPPDEHTNTHSDNRSSSSDVMPEPDQTDQDAGIPYLPFDRILCHEYPQEAFTALHLLFEGNKQAEQPQFDVTKHFLAELEVGSLVFQALGLTEEEAQEAAAAKALEALSDNQEEEEGHL